MARRLVSSIVVSGLLVSSLLVAVLLPAGPVLAQFESLSWSTIPTPSDEGFVVVGSEVSVLVTGSPTVWYAADIPNGKLYQTLDGGVTWQDDIQTNLEDASPAPQLPVWDLAVAPGDPAFLVAVTDDRGAVYLTRDGGDTWDPLNISTAAGWDPSLQIADVAVSPEYGADDDRDIAVGTRYPDGTVGGDVWVMTVDSGFGFWQGQGLDMDVSCVAFSPDYASDDTILAIASDDTGTFLATGYRTTASNTTLWQVTDPNLVDISLTDEDSPREDELIYSDIAVPSGYDGDSASARVVYVSYASLADTDDVYRIEDWRVHRMNLNRGEKVPVFSIAYYGGTLVAGEVGADSTKGRARIHFCYETTATYLEWEEPEKRPSGGFGTGVGNAIVAFTPGGGGNSLVCATSTNYVTTPAEWCDLTLPAGPWSGSPAGTPDESAISRPATNNDHMYWNQLSLIDTDMRELCDYALWHEGSAEDEPGNILYLASAGSGMDSIWRSTALNEEDLGLRWVRVDFLDCPAPTGDADQDEIILRRVPEENSNRAVFYAVRGTNLLYRSTDLGTSWTQVRECPDELSDVAVVTTERLYVLYNNLLAIGQVEQVRDFRVWRWTYDIDTGLQSGRTLRFHGNNYIFAGDNGEGEIAVSTDGAETFTVLPALPMPEVVHMTLDAEFARTRVIYAATEDNSSGIYRWTVGGSTDWTPLGPPDLGYTGLSHIKGVLYGAFGEGVDRTLVPNAVTILTSDWDRLTVELAAGTDFRSETLRTTAKDAVYIWAIDGRSYDYEAEQGRLWVYRDIYALTTPWPVSPFLAEVLPCDICDCEACPFCFEWRPLPKAETWDLWVALDEQFKHVLLEMEDVKPDCCDTPGTCYFEIPLHFDCSSTYYWRVRATGTTEGERVHTRWSPPMHFLVAAGSTLESMHVAPKIVTPEEGAQGVARTPGFSWTGFPATTVYQFELSTDNSFAVILGRAELDRTAYVYPGLLEAGGTYFWRVRALTPHPSEWSVASFSVMAQPAAVAVAVSPTSELAGMGLAASNSPTPLWTWVVIALLLLLIVCVLVYVVVDRRA